MNTRVVIFVFGFTLLPSTVPAVEEEGPPKGFRALLSQDSLAQWKTGDNIAKHWKLVDGVLHYDGKGERKGGTDDALNLVTRRAYRNFELWVDWKIAAASDSGIYLRGCPQIQIWDIRKYPEGSGGLYNNQKNPSKPLKPADNPVGQWNTFKIRIIGDTVTVRLNDVLVVDNVTMENYFDRSKPIPSEGSIGLQHHRSPISFRNIYVKELR